MFGGLLSAKCLCRYQSQPSALCRVGSTSTYRRENLRLPRCSRLFRAAWLAVVGSGRRPGASCLKPLSLLFPLHKLARSGCCCRESRGRP